MQIPMQGFKWLDILDYEKNKDCNTVIQCVMS